MLDYKWSN